MFKHRLLPAIAAASVLLLAGAVSAGPLNTKQVPAKAKWLVHADVKGFLATKTGAFVLEELKKKGLEAVLNNIQEAFAFDVTKDLHSVTVYGRRFAKDAAVVLLNATLDRERIAEMLRGNHTYREVKYSGHTIHQWTENPDSDPPGSTKFAVFHGKDLALMADRLLLVQEAVDVLDGRGASLPDRKAKASAKVFLTAFLTELPPLGEGKPEGAIFRKIASGQLQAGESQGQVQAQIAVIAKTAKTAESLRKLADGVLAFIDLASPEGPAGKPAKPGPGVVLDGKPVPPELIAVLKAVTVTLDGRSVQARANVPVARATALIRRIIHQNDDAEESQPAEN